MQQLSLDELKQVLFHAFRDHLTMKDIENIIITEEESLNENSGSCPEYEGGEELHVAPSLRRNHIHQTGGSALMIPGLCPCA